MSSCPVLGGIPVTKPGLNFLVPSHWYSPPYPGGNSSISSTKIKMPPPSQSLPSTSSNTRTSHPTQRLLPPRIQRCPPRITRIQVQLHQMPLHQNQSRTPEVPRMDPPQPRTLENHRKTPKKHSLHIHRPSIRQKLRPTRYHPGPNYLLFQKQKRCLRRFHPQKSQPSYRSSINRLLTRFRRNCKKQGSLFRQKPRNELPLP